MTGEEKTNENQASTVSSIYANDKQVPAIRLSGNWLVKNGFQTGRKFQVDEQPGSLTIRLILDEDERVGLKRR